MSHQIMNEMRVLSHSPFHSISEVTVRISPNPRDREIYYTSGYGDGKLYGIAKSGIEKLMMAAGIEEVDSESRRVDLRRWQSKWVGKYTQPDGKEIPLSGEKEMDLAIGGTRWDKRRETELDQLLKARAVDDGTFQKLHNGLKCNGQWVKTEHVIEYAASVLEEDMGKLIFQAEAKATRYVNQAAQFGMELAQSGARHRAVRAIMQIGQYTQRQLEEPFVVLRSRFDWEAMRSHLGDEMVKRLKAARAAQSMGLPDAVVAGLLTAPVATVEELVEVGDKLTEPQAMSAEVAMADLFDDAPPVLNGAEDDAPLPGPASEPEPTFSTERPYDADTIKVALLSRVSKAGNGKAVTEKQAPFLARKFAEAFAPADDATHKYHVSLAWFTGKTSANDLTFGWAKALLDWLLGGNEPDETGDTPLGQFASAEAGNVYRQAMAAAGQQVMELGEGEEPDPAYAEYNYIREQAGLPPLG